MEVRVLHIPDCPNTRAALDLVASLIEHRCDVTVSATLVESAERAAELGMHGSPTILIDGVDPFSAPGAPASMSCRVFLSEGRARGVPDRGALAAALGS